MLLKEMDKPIVVRHPQDLSINWAQNIVSRYAANAKVSGVKLNSVDIGTSTRLRLEVDHDAHDIVPSRWFVKTPSLTLKPRMITSLPRFLHKEVKFYRSLSCQVPVRVPRVLAAESHFGRGSTLVMSDLTEQNFKPGQAADALSADQAGQIDVLALLHGHYWTHGNALGEHRWLNDFSLRTENHMGSLLAVPLMKRGLKRADNLVAARLYKPALRYAAKRRHFMSMLVSPELQTLVHHDCHPGNIFWTQSGPGFLDWQLVRLGEGIGDVAYFLATALEPEVRRKYEYSILDRYCHGLAGLGVKQVNDLRLFQRYRAHLIYPFEAMLMTLAIGGMMDKKSNLELLRRSATAAADDHDSFRAIGA